MPCPIAKLAYGLRHRLSELATPIERYDLQIAAGAVSICPPKRQTIREFSPMFACENGSISVYGHAMGQPKTTQIVLYKNTLFKCRLRAVFKNFDLPDLASESFTHFILQPFMLVLQNCNISKHFIDTLFNKVGTVVKNVEIMNNADYRFLPRNYFAVLSMFENRSLKLLRFIVLATQFTLSDFVALTKFLGAQQQGFSLQLVILQHCEQWDLHFPKLKLFLNERLKYCGTLPPHGCTYVYIRYRDVTHAWYSSVLGPELPK
uniref:FBD domain-containing protein n=1 Tax=Panagrellus redivivus TaxID=6233 RepID=A0A7E4UV53_PANRE